MSCQTLDPHAACFIDVIRCNLRILDEGIRRYHGRKDVERGTAELVELVKRARCFSERRHLYFPVLLERLHFPAAPETDKSDRLNYLLSIINFLGSLPEDDFIRRTVKIIAHDTSQNDSFSCPLEKEEDIEIKLGSPLTGEHLRKLNIDMGPWPRYFLGPDKHEVPRWVGWDAHITFTDQLLMSGATKGPEQSATEAPVAE